MKKFLSCLCLCSLVLMGGCARRISQNYYTSASVGEVAHTYKGQIISARRIEVGEAERLQDNQVGMAVGGIGGAVLGSQVGGGNSAPLIGGLVGAIAGGIGGAFAQDALSKQEGMEYVVQLDNGQVMSVVQGADEIYTPGQRVFVIVSTEGRSRVVLDTTPAAVAPMASQATVSVSPVVGNQPIQQPRQAQVNVIKHVRK